MHASIEQLLSLRDGEPVDAVTERHVSACALCRAELDRLRALRQGLRELAEFAPPPLRGVAGQAGARPRVRRRGPVLAGALAASLAAVMLLALLLPEPRPAGEADPRPTAGQTLASAGLDELMLRSRQLEGLLDRVPVRNQVMDAGTAVTVAELEDSIALVDWRLNQAAAVQSASPGLQRALWRQRVDLMQSLVTVRYAQAGAGSF